MTINHEFATWLFQIVVKGIRYLFDNFDLTLSMLRFVFLYLLVLWQLLALLGKCSLFYNITVLLNEFSS